MKILKTMFGELKTGNLRRLPYLGYSCLLIFVPIVVLGLFILSASQDLDVLAGLFLVILFPLVGGTLWGGYVLSVKRFRNLAFKNPEFIGGIYIAFNLLSRIITKIFEYNQQTMPYIVWIIDCFIFCIPCIFLWVFLYFLPEGFVQQRPLKILFADIKKGSLRRDSFFGYFLLTYIGLSVVSIVFYGAGLGNDIIVPSSAIISVVYGYMIFVLSVKRLRHINFRYPITLSFVFLIGDLVFFNCLNLGYNIVFLLLCGWIGSKLLIFLFLLFAPGNLFKRDEKPDKFEPATP